MPRTLSMSLSVLVAIALAVVMVNGMTLQVQVLYNGTPAPSSMALRGDGLGLNWNKGASMSKSASNQYMWTLDLAFNASQVGTLLQVKPLVGDSTWSIGANMQVVVPRNSASVALYPWFRSKSGRYSVVGSVYSPQLNNTRPIVVYTPPSYLENTLKVQRNVLVMQDGQNLFNASTSFGGTPWNCGSTIDQLVVQGAIDELLVIGVYNTPDRLDEYTYSYDPCYDTVRGKCVGGGGKGDLYLDFVIETVVPWSAQRFRIATARPNLGIMGSSLGALISCYAGWTRPSVFSKAGCMSSSFWWNTEDFNNVILKDYPPPPAGEEFYLDSGDCCPTPSGDDRFQTLRVVGHMEELGYKMGQNLFHYLDQGGQHNEYYWGRRFHIPMTDLYPPSPLPTTPQ